MFQSNKQKIQSQTVLGVYLFLLVWMILFKFSFCFSDLPQIRSINPIPFKESVIVNGELDVSEIIYNIIAFIPLGVYVHIFRPHWSFDKKLLPGLCLSLFFEIIQFAFGIGASDITDVIGNTLGGLLGVCGCMLACRLLKAKAVTVINGLGIAIEAFALAMIMLLTVANL